MRIHIIGAGAVGLLVASYLVKAGLQVTLVTRTSEQREYLLVNGLYLQNLTGEEECITVNAEVSLKVEPGDLVIVTVKYNQLAGIYEQLQALPKSAAVLFLQNGLAHFEEVVALDFPLVAFGSVQFGAQKIAANRVAHRGIGTLKIAMGRGEFGIVKPLLAVSNSAFPVELVAEAEAMLFEKALLNCLINPITAVLQIKNGELLKNRAAYQLLQALYEELMTAFPAMRSTLPFEKIRLLCERTALNTSSMLADRLQGKQTEAISIIGAVIKKAQVPVPTLQTLYHLILAIDEGGVE